MAGGLKTPWLQRMRPGSLVKYKTDARYGIIVKIIDRFSRDDNIVVLWQCGRKWCVKDDWIEVVIK